MRNTPGMNRGYPGREFAQGTPVYDNSGNQVGAVSEHGVQDGYLIVHHGWLNQDVYVPLNAVARNDAGGVGLTLTQDQFGQLAHNHEPATGPNPDSGQIQNTQPNAAPPRHGPPVSEDEYVARNTAANQALNNPNRANPQAGTGQPLAAGLITTPTTNPVAPPQNTQNGYDTTVRQTELRETTLPPNERTNDLTRGEITSEGVTFEQPNTENNVGNGRAMNESGGWSNLGNRDLVTGTPASAQVEGATPSWPDGNNVAGTREGPELMEKGQVMGIGGRPVGNDTGVMGTGAGPVGYSMGPGVTSTNQRNTMGAEGTADAAAMSNSTNSNNASAGYTPQGQQGHPSVPNPAQRSTAGSGYGDDVTVNSNQGGPAQHTLSGQGETNPGHAHFWSGGPGDNPNALDYPNAGTKPSQMTPTTNTTNATNQGQSYTQGTSARNATSTSSSDVTVNGNALGSGDSTTIDLHGQRPAGAREATQPTLNTPTQRTAQGGRSQNAIDNSNAGTEFTGSADPGALANTTSPHAGVIPGGIGSRAAGYEVAGTTLSPDAPLQGANTPGVAANTADTGIVGANTTAAASSPARPGTMGTASNTGPNAQLRSGADVGAVSTSDAAGTEVVREESLRQQLRADQPIGDVRSPEENANTPQV